MSHLHSLPGAASGHSACRVLTREEVRLVDQYAITELGIDGVVLMENAGRGCVDVLLQQGSPAAVVVLCGAGNNGGDGYVIARHLAVRGVAVRCVPLTPIENLTGDARHNADLALRLDEIEFWEFSGELTAEQFKHAFAPLGETPVDTVVDAMLGTGAKGELREPFLTAVEEVNKLPVTRLAVDVPTGLDCDEGKKHEPVFRADATCSFVALKPGLLEPSSKDVIGTVHVLDIGIPHSIVHRAVEGTS